MIKWENDLKKQYELLDRFDFTPYLDLYPDLNELMRAFEYECDVGLLPPEFENCVFNFINMQEFKEYLSKRYMNYNFYEVVTYIIKKREEN